MTDDAWTPGRLGDRFASIDQRFTAVEHTIRSFAPIVGQIAGAEADVDGLQREVKQLHDDVREIDAAVNGLVRHSRAEQLKYLAYIVGPAMALAAAYLFSGKGP